MRIALLTTAVPLASNPGVGIYNVHQAAALAAAGAPTELFVAQLISPPVLGPILPGGRDLAARRRTPALDGVPLHVVSGLFLHPRTLRHRVAPRLPRLAGRLFGLGVRRPLRRELSRFRPDVLMIHDGRLWGEVARDLSPRLGCEFAIIEHARRDVLTLRRGTALGTYYRELAGAALAVFVVGRSMAEHLRSELAIDHVTLVQNGAVLPDDESSVLPRPPHWRDRVVILCVGSFEAQDDQGRPRKGHAELLRAFALAEVPGAHLVMVGQPSPAVARLVSELKLEAAVEFLPRMPQPELLQYMRLADVFALPSWQEAFGLVYVESMACRTPVIMTSDCGVAEEITHGEHGWIVPPRDVPALAEALREALTRADLARMGEAGRALVEQRFTWTGNARQVITTLQAARGAANR